VTVTRDGLVWVGTSSGLVRFEHRRWVRMGRAQPAFRRDPIVGIFEDRSWHVWIATERALFRGTAPALVEVTNPAFVDGTESGHAIPGVRAVVETADGDVWLVAGRAWRVRGGDLAQIEPGDPPQAVAPFVDPTTTATLRTRGGGADCGGGDEVLWLATGP